MNSKGQSLIEVMVALGVSVIIITAIVMSVVLAIVNTQVAKTQNLASYYAKQGLEILRQASRSDWNTFAGYSGKYCLYKNALTPEKMGLNCRDDNSNFRREINFISPQQTEGNECQIGNTGAFGSFVTVAVSWNDNKCPDQSFCHEVKLNSCFQNINAVSAP